MSESYSKGTSGAALINMVEFIGRAILSLPDKKGLVL